MRIATGGRMLLPVDGKHALLTAGDLRP